MKPLDMYLDKVLEDIHSYPKAQGDIMRAEDFFHAFKSMETSLNTLYEKVRLLEDAETKAYLYISHLLDRCEDALIKSDKEIKALTDAYHNKESFTISVPIERTLDTLTDRDGTPIPSMDITHHALTVPHVILKKAVRIGDYTIKANDVLYTKDHLSRATILSYLTDSIYEKGLSLEIGTRIEEGAFNYVRVGALHGEVTSLRVGDITLTEGLEDGVYMPLTTSASVSFTLNSKNYHTLRIPVIPKPKPPPPPPEGYDARLDPTSPAFNQVYYNEVKESLTYHYTHGSDRKYKHEVPYHVGYHAVDGIVSRAYGKAYKDSESAKKSAPYDPSRIQSAVSDILSSYGKKGWNGSGKHSGSKSTSKGSSHSGFGGWDGKGSFSDYATGKGSYGKSKSSQTSSKSKSSGKSKGKGSSKGSSKGNKGSSKGGKGKK